MKVFEVIVDDGKEVFKSVCSAKSKRALRKIYGGNGDFIKVTDITNTVDYASLRKRIDNLLANCEDFNKAEKSLVSEIIEQEYMNYLAKKNAKNTDDEE